MLVKPAIMRSKVVLPQPDGPKSVKSSPLLIDKFKFGMTTLLPNCLRAFLIVIVILKAITLLIGGFVLMRSLIHPEVKRWGILPSATPSYLVHDLGQYIHVPFDNGCFIFHSPFLIVMQYIDFRHGSLERSELNIFPNWEVVSFHA